jgi:short-subunit dehydrogenase
VGAWERVPERKLALVTGASGGLGLEFAKLLAAGGYDLALVARSASKLNDIAKALRVEHGIDVLTVVQDLSLPGAADAVVADVPRCDVLINNAGFASNGRFDRLAPERVREEVMLDVVALTELTRRYVDGMTQRGNGKIMNVASTAGFLPGPFMAVYYAAKAYVISFSEALWEELRGTGVSVTCFCPGATATDFGDRAGMGGTFLFAKMPLAKASEVALDGYRAMQRGTRLAISRPFTNWFVSIAPLVTPRPLLLWISRKMVEVEPAP